MHNQKNTQNIYPLIVISTLMMVLLYSCSPKKKATAPLPAGCDTLRIGNTKLSQANGATWRCVNEAFIDRVADKYTISYIIKEQADRLDMRKEPFQNIHDTTRIDTIYHFSGTRDSIKFYKGRNKSFLIDLVLTGAQLGLTRCIRPGMSKALFLKIFGIPEDTGNTIHITNQDETLVFIFHFDGDVLRRIESEIYFG